MMLNTILHGTPSEKPPLVIAHGLFGSGRNWGVIAKRLSVDRQVIAVDMRNHGDSPRDPAHDYPAMAGDLAEVIASLGGPAAVLGHSMGGKAAMMLALTAPELVERLIVADIAPVAYDHSQMNFVRAMQSVDLGQITRRSDAEGQLAAGVEDPALRAFFLQSLALGEAGARWKLNLEVLAAQMPAIMGFPEVTGAYPGRALFLTGGNSDYVGAENWPRIHALFPAAEQVSVPDTGHWLHAEAPRAFVEVMTEFLR